MVTQTEAIGLSNCDSTDDKSEIRTSKVEDNQEQAVENAGLNDQLSIFERKAALINA